MEIVFLENGMKCSGDFRTPQKPIGDREVSRRESKTEAAEEVHIVLRSLSAIS